MSEPALYIERFATPTGRMLLVSDEAQCLRAAEWVDHEERIGAMLQRCYGQSSARLHAPRQRSRARLAFEAYFGGDFKAILALETRVFGTPFQQQVWAELRRIPLGSTISYGTLARRIGRPAAVRAVGLANGANPVPVVVPCHRVIGANGTLVGFGGGLDRKQWLLAHEGAISQEGAQLQLHMRA